MEISHKVRSLTCVISEMNKKDKRKKWISVRDRRKSKAEKRKQELKAQEFSNDEKE